jgi:hypothetical protein
VKAEHGSTDLVLRYNLEFLILRQPSDIIVTPLSDCNGAAGCGPSFGTYEKSKVESQKHKDDANIHYQSFPESISEETEI